MSNSTAWSHASYLLRENPLIGMIENHPAKQWVKVSTLFGEIYESQDKQSLHANKRRLAALKMVLAVLDSVESTLAIAEKTT